MGSNFKGNFDGDYFKNLKNDFNRLIRNFKRGRCKGRRVNTCCVIGPLKWAAVGGILTLLVISQIGIPLAFICIAIIVIAVICNRW